MPLCEGAAWAHSDPEEKDLKLCKCLCFVLLRCSGGITFSWPELYSQGVYHGLSAKEMGSHLQEGTQRTGMRTGSGTR